MTYALETKKRKFERLLESLTDSSTQARGTLHTHNDPTSTNTRPLSGTDLSKRRRITPVGNLQQASNVSTASLVAHYLPSSRLAFLERLESFRQVTKWHISSSSPINAVEWAKRGWICQDTDTVSCSQCKERLHIDIDVETRAESMDGGPEDEQNNSESDSLATTDAILQGLFKRYQDMVVIAHTETCPWRRRGCDSSIQRIEGLLNMPTALAGLEQRYKSIAEDHMDVPTVTLASTSDQHQLSTQDIETFRFSDTHSAPNVDVLKLAMCGWERKDTDIVECRHCFRSLGLWLYRGIDPTMEHLDATDSHLEYCPWRSDVAQDTELPSHDSHGATTKTKLPGWVLVHLAVVKRNSKANGPRTRDTSRQAHDADEDVQPQLSPEQREKKMKDLMKRIKDLKKPFNVKSLLKRTEKTVIRTKS